MPDAQPDGYLAAPAGDSSGAVLVLHAWWGLNDTMKTFCDRLAEAGFLVFAPDLYHGKVATTIPEAEKLGGEVDAHVDRAKNEIADAASFLLERGRQPKRGLAVIGFSLGGFYAVDLSAADPEHIRSVVLFYGTGPADLSKSKASYLGHFAENDPYEPRKQADSLEAALKKAGRPVEFHHYPNAGHWFFEPDRTDGFNEPAATLAWERTLAFLRKS